LTVTLQDLMTLSDFDWTPSIQGERA